MGEQFKPHTNTKKWLAGLGVVTVLVGLGLAAYFIFFHKPAQPAPKPFNLHSDAINRLENQTVPADPMAKLSYYSQLGQHYEDLHDNDNALKNYLKAQAVVDESVQGQVVFYMPIANLYHQKNDKAKATEYYKKEITYLQQFAQQHPDQTANINQTIATVEEQIKAL